MEGKGPLEVNQAKIADLQNRIQELQREQQTALSQQNKLFTALQSEAQTSSPAQVSDPQSGEPSASDPIREERRKRAYLSLFSSNVALSYRKDSPQPESAVTNDPSGSQDQPGQQPIFDQQLSQILQTLPPMPQSVAPAPLVSGSARQAGTTTAEEAEKKASESTPKQPSQNPSPLSAAEGKTYVLFEGTILETVLLNRLTGDFNGLVECLVTNDIYSHDRQHVLIPSGAKVLGEAKRVEAFGQTRLAVAFHRLIMPDGYSVSLDQFKASSMKNALNMWPILGSQMTAFARCRM